MTCKNFDIISRILGESAKETAEASMIGAVNKLPGGASNDSDRHLCLYRSDMAKNRVHIDEWNGGRYIDG